MIRATVYTIKDAKFTGKILDETREYIIFEWNKKEIWIPKTSIHYIIEDTSVLKKIMN
jgi:hypothetical protein